MTNVPEVDVCLSLADKELIDDLRSDLMFESKRIADELKRIADLISGILDEMLAVRVHKARMEAKEREARSKDKPTPLHRVDN